MKSEPLASVSLLSIYRSLLSLLFRFPRSRWQNFEFTVHTDNELPRSRLRLWCCQCYILVEWQCYFHGIWCWRSNLQALLFWTNNLPFWWGLYVFLQVLALFFSKLHYTEIIISVLIISDYKFFYLPLHKWLIKSTK